MNINRFTAFGLLALALSFTALAQNRTKFTGRISALDYAFGIGGGGTGIPGPLVIGGGPYTTGTQTITVAFGYAVAGDGTTFYPLNINAPILVGGPSNQETVTPTAVSCSTPAVYNSCSFTASFANAHGFGENVASATYGLSEAVNLAGSSTGGMVDLSASWATAGGTNATIALVTPLWNVGIEDMRSTPLRYWGAQPTTLSTIAAPTTLTNTTVTFTASPVGTWGTSAYYFCITYVDILGGESACSASYTQTPGTTAYSLNITSPAASAGAVGWRAYGGVTSTALAYLLPITSTNCTLTTLEGVMPACAIGSNAVFPAIYVTTGALSPVITPVTSVNNPVPQSHTTFAYQPSGVPPVPFQTNYGPFGAAAVSSAASAATTILGTFELPAGYLNWIGRTVRVTGKIKLTAGASSTLSIQTGMVWAAGVVAGLPTAVCNSVSGFVFATQPYTDVSFRCDMTTNAVGATAVGSIMPDSFFIASYAAGTLIPVGADTSAAAIGSLGLFAQDEFSISILPSVAADTTVQLMSLHIETIQ
jgi:hypothetical protein